MNAPLLHRTGSVCLALFFATVALRAAPANEDKTAIKSARLSQNQAIARHDPDGIALFWTDDVTICRGLGVQVAGKAAYRQIFQDDPNGVAAIVYERIPDAIAYE